MMVPSPNVIHIKILRVTAKKERLSHHRKKIHLFCKITCLGWLPKTSYLAEYKESCLHRCYMAKPTNNIPEAYPGSVEVRALPSIGLNRKYKHSSIPYLPGCVFTKYIFQNSKKNCFVFLLIIIVITVASIS